MMKKVMFVIAMCLSMCVMAQTPKLVTPNWKDGLTELVKSNPSTSQIDNYFVQYKVSTSMVLTQLLSIEPNVKVECTIGCVVSYVICRDICDTPHSCAWCDADYSNCQKSCGGTSLKQIELIKQMGGLIQGIK